MGLPYLKQKKLNCSDGEILSQRLIKYDSLQVEPQSTSYIHFKRFLNYNQIFMV